MSRAEQQLRYLGVTEGPQRREDLVATTSQNLPAWADGKPHTFFAAAERYEGVDRVAFTEWKITLPRELSHRENLALAHDLANHKSEALANYRKLDREAEHPGRPVDAPGWIDGHFLVNPPAP